jgi:type II secretory pathway pseudopilin PulG
MHLPVTSRRCGRLRRRAIAAYTIVEVMMALSILSVGATGVIAMQKASLVGNLRARDLATANAIASAWMERLRVDGLRWTLLPGNLSTIAQTQWLSAVGNDHPTVNSPEGEWIRPAELGAWFMSPGADVRGLDTTEPADQGFCTHLRLTQLLPNLIRAEVRVFWLRQQGGGTIDGANLCAVDPAALEGSDADVRYHFVHLVSGITRHDG